MPTQTGTTSVAVATSLRTSYTNVLLGVITQGSLIQASHLNELSNFINAVRNHTHTLTDNIVIKEFGNTGSPSSATRTTSIPDFGGTDYPFVATGGTILASDHAYLRTNVNDARVHAHTFSDNDGV